MTEEKKYIGRGGNRGGGRPRKTKEERNGLAFQVYATKEDHALITDEAKRRGFNRSEFIVMAVKNFVKNG